MKLERALTEKDICLTVPEDAKEARVLVMHLDPLQVRVRREADLPVRKGRVLPQPEQDVLYISVTDRHSGEAKTASAFVGGFGLKQGAFATSLSPDDDNVVCIGASVSDMVRATQYLFEIGGGQVIVQDGEVMAAIELPICGIMADVTAVEMADQERVLRQRLFSMGVTIPRPFFSIIFLSITAIPEFAITDLGLVEAASRQVVNPVLSWA